MGNTLVPGNACEAELARMIKQYGGMLVGTCTMLLGDADLAQDAVQETFIKAYHRMDSFRSEFEGSEKAWLTRIAVNVCRDHQRSRWFRFVDRRTPIDSLILAAPEAGESAWDLYRAVQSLPKRYGEVILLHYYQERAKEFDANGDGALNIDEYTAMFREKFEEAEREAAARADSKDDKNRNIGQPKVEKHGNPTPPDVPQSVSEQKDVQPETISNSIGELNKKSGQNFINKFIE